MRRRSGLLSGLLLAGLALTVQAQDKLPGTGQPASDVVSGAAVDDLIRQTVLQSSAYDGPSGPAYNLEGGLELLLLRPYWDNFSNDSAFVSSNFPDNFNVSVDQAPEYEFEPAFRIWLAAAGDGGFGGRIRYFFIDADSETVTLAGSSFGDFEAESITTSLKMHVLDLEGTAQRVWPRWTALAAAGLRYAHLERGHVLSEVDDDTEFSVEQGENTYDGFGPTFALEGRRRLGQGGLAFFINGRASLLFGESHYQEAEIFGDENGPDFLDVFEYSTDNSVLILESQFGLEYARPFRLGEGFARIALETQYWLDGGNIVGFGHDHDDLTLLGLSLAAGLRR